jgi:hypothetical protein
MAADWRTLKLEVLAETKQFVKGMDDANRKTESFGDKLNDFSKKASVAFAAAGAVVGAFAIKLGKDSVEAAIKAEAEQNRLNQILLTTNGATQVQIGLLDDQADALQRLGVVSGGNIKVVQAQLATFDLSFESIQRLTPAILDYVTAEKGASASADDFKSATNGLAQALNGNFASLTATGFVLDDTTKELIKNGTESERSAALVGVLDSTYKDFNSTLLGTTEGRLQNVNNQFDDLKVTIGTALLPIFEDLMQFIADTVIPLLQDKVVPAVEAFIAGLTGNKGLTNSLSKSQETAIKWGQNVAGFIKVIINLKDEILFMGAALTGVFVVNRIAAGVAAIITLITTLRKALAALRASAMIAGVAQAFALNPLLGVGAVALGIGVMTAAKAAFGGDDNVSVGGGAGTGGNTVRAESLPSGFTAGASRVKASGSSTAGISAGVSTSSVPLISGISSSALQGLVPSGNAIPSGFDVAAARRAEEADRPITINVNAPSAIDEEGFTRAVILALNNTDRRTGGGGSQLII